MAQINRAERGETDRIGRVVEQLFWELARPCENPVTGDQFMLGLDPLAPQMRRACLALRACEYFAEFGPPHLQPLPLSYDDREALKRLWNPELSIFSWYARSLSALDFAIQDHPSFHDFARGVMASEYAPGFVKNNKRLQELYPARELPGLATGLYWRKPAIIGSVGDAPCP